MDEQKKVDRPILTKMSMIYIGVGFAGLATLLTILQYFGFPIKTYISAIADFITKTAWPMVVVGVIIYYHNEIRGLLKRIHKGKFLGAEFEAKLEEAEKAANEAYAAIAQLKELGLSLARPTIESISHIGQVNKAPTIQYQLSMVENIRNTLHRLGASEEEIRIAEFPIRSHLTIIHGTAVLVSLQMMGQIGITQFMHTVSTDEEINNARTKIEQYIKENHFQISDTAQEELEDLSYFVETGKLRRPQIWNHERQIALNSRVWMKID